MSTTALGVNGTCLTVAEVFFFKCFSIKFVGDQLVCKEFTSLVHWDSANYQYKSVGLVYLLIL